MGRVEQAQRLTALLSKVGYALWQFAELEDVAVGFFVIRLRPVRGVGVVAAQPVIDSAEKKSFGEVLHKLLKANTLPSDLGAELQRVLKERNWLVHRAKRESRGVLNSPIAYDLLLARLDRLAEDSLATQKQLAAHIEAYTLSSGVPREVIDAEAAALRRAWGYE